jgi:hypothetical protein
MRITADDLAPIGTLTDPDFDRFSEAVTALLSRSFIVRGIEKEERLYDFSIRNMALLEAWFSCAGITLKRDEGLGVIACRAVPGMKIRFSLEDTCTLLTLRLLYEEKRGELSLARHPSVSVFDFMSRYRALTDRELAKTKLFDILRRMASHRLVALTGDATDPECAVVLYPSLALALDQAGIDETLAAIEREKGVAAAEPENTDTADGESRNDDHDTEANDDNA